MRIEITRLDYESTQKLILKPVPIDVLILVKSKTPQPNMKTKLLFAISAVTLPALISGAVIGANSAEKRGENEEAYVWASPGRSSVEKRGESEEAYVWASPGRSEKRGENEEAYVWASPGRSEKRGENEEAYVWASPGRSAEAAE